MSSSSAAACAAARGATQRANKVQGCASQVWLVTTCPTDGADGPVLSFVGDSDAHIVRGLIAILLATLFGPARQDILATDADALFDRLGLREHLTPQRSNGLPLHGRAHQGGRARRARACRVMTVIRGYPRGRLLRPPC